MQVVINIGVIIFIFVHIVYNNLIVISPMLCASYSKVMYLNTRWLMQSDINKM